MSIQPHSSQIYYNGHILSGYPFSVTHQALGVLNGRVYCVGSNEDSAQWAGPHTQKIDLQGSTLIPGFNDAHCHILLYGLSLVQVNARGARSIPEIAGVIRRAAAESPPGKWIRGGRYSDQKLAERRHPTRYELDDVSLQHPVFLTHVSGHMAVANSLGLATAGITRDSPEPPGGAIERDMNGEPTGLLRETAQKLVEDIMPPYSLDELKQALRAAGRQMAAEGITCAQDAWAGWIAPQEFRAYQEVIADGTFPLRVRLMVDYDSLPTRDDRIDFGFGLCTGFGDDRLRLGAVKLFVDGSLIGKTASLNRPYASDPSTSGMLIREPEELVRAVQMVHESGWQVAMHAIGDRAIQVALDAIETTMGGKAERFRPRIEHCGVLLPDLIERIRRLGVIVVTQPRFIVELGDSMRTALGEERIRLTYPLASLRGLAVAFSSDRPVVHGAPLLGIQAAMKEMTESSAVYAASEAITFQESLRWYTQGSAYASFDDAILGNLMPGKLADFAVLARNPLETPAEELSDTRVLRTVVGGATVYEA